jgi:hypothetical protein
MAGVSAHPHVGDGHVCTMGNGGGDGGGRVDFEAKLRFAVVAVGTMLIRGTEEVEE